MRSAGLALVQPCRALRAQPLERVAEVGKAEHLALAQQPPLGRVQRRRLRIVGDDRLQHREHVGVHRRHGDALARVTHAGLRPARRTASSRTGAQTSHSPAGTPGTPQDAGPMLKRCGTSSNSTSTATSSPRAEGSIPRPPASTKKSSRWSSPAAVWASMNPPAPSAVSWLSTASEASTAQTAASNALPPSLSTCAPASAVSGCPAATTPLMMVGSLRCRRGPTGRVRTPALRGRIRSPSPWSRRTRGSPSGSWSCRVPERRVGRSP